MATPDRKELSFNRKAEAFVRAIARLHYDGEDIDDGTFSIEGDRAVRAYNRIVEEARKVVGVTA